MIAAKALAIRGDHFTAYIRIPNCNEKAQAMRTALGTAPR